MPKAKDTLLRLIAPHRRQQDEHLGAPAHAQDNIEINSDIRQNLNSSALIEQAEQVATGACALLRTPRHTPESK